MATSSNSIGKFYLIRQVKPRARWGASTVPVYDPNWIVEFRLPDQKGIRESSKMPICDLCLAEAENPARTRDGCRVANCQGEVTRWAEVRLATMAQAWKAGRLTPKVQTQQRVSLEDVRKLYNVTGPSEKTKCLRALEMVTCEVLGKDWKDIYLDEFSPDWWDKFAWMYQEQERRGWLKRDGSKPADYLQQLRRACPTHPHLDRDSASTANGTIKSVMRKAKAVLGQESQDNYLKALRDRFPESGGFLRWHRTKVSVQTLDGRFALDPDVYQKMWDALPALKENDPQVWALIRLHWKTGLRPIEAMAASPSWLEVDGNGCVVIVVKNRDDWKMKDRTTKQSRPWPLPQDLVEMLPDLVNERSIFGATSVGQMDAIYRRASAWMRAQGVEGTQTLYTLRKLVATVKVANEGADAGARALGHAKTTTTMEFYAGSSQPITALSDEDLSPVNVMGTRRVQWTMPVTPHRAGNADLIL